MDTVILVLLLLVFLTLSIVAGQLRTERALQIRKSVVILGVLFLLGYAVIEDGAWQGSLIMIAMGVMIYYFLAAQERNGDKHE
jgi:CHASE2 domain-containing sensor protein